MNLMINNDFSKNYASNSQKSKNITEPWILENFPCPFCKSKLKQYPANNKCSDYYCEKCDEDFELKSIKGKFSKKKITGSEYFSTIEKINTKKPNWILLERNDIQVTGLTLIPNYFFYNDMIEKRNELSSKAQRAGWTGCLIRVDMIPSFAKIQFVKNGVEVSEKIIKYKLSMINRFKNIDTEKKDWKLILMYLIDRIPDTIFSLNELYSNIDEFKLSHPNNNFIKENIRHTLQLLRDEGYVKFLDSEGYKGIYLKLF